MLKQFAGRAIIRALTCPAFLSVSVANFKGISIAIPIAMPISGAAH